MSQRLFWGRFFIRLGGFIRSLAVMVMRPDDLIEFSRQAYARSKSVELWSEKDLLDSGLNSDETNLLDKLPMRKGRLLILGVGGGREAISLARIGFEVTGVDYIPEMVEKAKENAARQGFKISGRVQDISKLEVPANYYDVIWLSAVMYSCIPTRKRRVWMLKKIRRALRSEGYFLCQFQMDRKGGSSRKVQLAKRAFAFLSLGNFWYEKGDTLWGSVEFIHGFSSEEELRSEFEEGGFEVSHFHIPERGIRGGSVMKRS